MIVGYHKTVTPVGGQQFQFPFMYKSITLGFEPREGGAVPSTGANLNTIR